MELLLQRGIIKVRLPPPQIGPEERSSRTVLEITHNRASYRIVGALFPPPPCKKTARGQCPFFYYYYYLQSLPPANKGKSPYIVVVYYYYYVVVVVTVEDKT